MKDWPLGQYLGAREVGRLATCSRSFRDGFTREHHYVSTKRSVSGRVWWLIGHQQLPRLRTLDSFHDNIGFGAQMLRQGLRACRNLSMLRLVFITLAPAQAVMIIEGLRNCPCLETLDLGYNDMGSDGARALASALPAWPCWTCRTTC